MRDYINNNPEYFDNPIREFRGNPLVEALQPPPGNAWESSKRLAQKPDFDESEREYPSCFRQLLPARLLNFMFPTKQHIQLLGRLYGQILNGYRWRNPTTVLCQELLHRNSTPASQESGNNLRAIFSKMPAHISFITGLSGTGKSTFIRSGLPAIGDQVIKHSKYKGAPFNETQILYMMRNVPDQCSAKAVCKKFGDYADELLGANLYGKLFSSKSLTRTDYVSALQKIISNHHIGALVIDEFQNISLARSGGKGELLALILNMREELGIPIILVGTYRAAALLKEEASIARRLVEGGFHELKRPEDSSNEDWRALCHIVWKYQWVRKPIDLSDEASQVLYDCSQGITGIMLNLFVTTQTYAIEEEIETITPQLIKTVYQDRFRPLHRIIDILRENNPQHLAQYDDLYFSGMSDLKNTDPIQNRIELIRTDMEQRIEKQRENLKNQSNETTEKDLKRRVKGNTKPSAESLYAAIRDETQTKATIFEGIK